MAEKRILKNGILIAIEGIDGAGKTTQSQMLCEKLCEEGYSAVLLHEPTNGQWGQKIKELAKNGRHEITPEAELDLFYKDRIEDVEKNISPSIREKKVIVMDRYYYSNVTYQGARGLDPDYVEKKNEKIAPKPDLVVILDIPPPESSRRIIATRKDGPNHFERTDYLEKVRNLFLQHFSGRTNVRVINGDGNHSKQEVFDCLWSLVKPKVLDAEETYSGRRRT
jgi:dTMP kinase